MAKLGEVFPVIRNGVSIKQESGAGGFPITRIETISNRTVNRSKMGYAGILDIGKYQDYILQDGDILMSHINSEAHLGKVALYAKQGNEQIIHGMNLLMLRSNSKKLLPEYAKCYFESWSFLRQIQRITKKSVNQASFTVTALKEVEIPCVDIDVQKEIVKRLQKLEQLISLRKQQLVKLDDLVKARFVEMFGEPRSNPSGFDKKPLKSTCKVITGNTPSRSESENYGDFIEWIKTDNIIAGLLNPTSAVEKLSEEGAKRGKIVHKGAILMVCIAGSVASIGRVCVTDRTVAFNQQINAIVSEKYNVIFLYILLQMSKDYLVEDVNLSLKGILSKSKLEDKEFIIPPLSLQNDFAAFVERVDQQKQTVQQSLDKLELMKKALMQEYFG